MIATEKEVKPKQVAFDEEGVAKYIRDKLVLNWFRKVVERYSVPLAKQAELAALLLNEAVEHNRGRLTLPFIRNYKYEDYIPSYVKHGGGTEVDEKIGEQIKLEAVEYQLQRELQNFMRGLGIMSRSGHVVDGLLEQYPQVPFKIDNKSRRAIQLAKRVIDDLAEKLKPISRWGLIQILDPPN
jgi:hypothetical protein